MDTKKLTIICVAYERVVPLRILIDCFVVQTNKNWMLYIVYDGPAPKKIKKVMGLYNDDRIMLVESEERNQHYGHPNRKWMLERLPSCKDFLLMTNDDNYYVPRFVELMLAECKEDVGLVYCDTTHSHAAYATNFSELKENYIDMGAFIVRQDVAKETGFNYICFNADGKYAVECAAACKKKNLKTVYINKSLFIHN